MLTFEEQSRNLETGSPKRPLNCFDVCFELAKYLFACKMFSSGLQCCCGWDLSFEEAHILLNDPKKKTGLESHKSNIQTLWCCLGWARILDIFLGLQE